MARRPAKAGFYLVGWLWSLWASSTRPNSRTARVVIFTGLDLSAYITGPPVHLLSSGFLDVAMKDSPISQTSGAELPEVAERVVAGLSPETQNVNRSGLSVTQYPTGSKYGM
ncbi:hypothetical protein PM082_007847 [Marasmius tenuissimus]|nr:hypothetical protein PM082_007847 [Marasmius tenuissimus]